MRAVNLFWGALALMGMYRVGQRLKIPWLPLLLAIQPYFWFYLNEARPYALQLAGGAWLLVALVEFISARGAGTPWAWQFALTSVFLFAATMLAPLPVAMLVFIGIVLAWRHNWRIERKSFWIVLGGFLACLPLAIYYVTTLMRGVKGSQMWSVDLKFVLYVFYELTGMGGIGLSPLEIRSLSRSPQLAHELISHLPQLILPVLLGMLLAVVIFIGLRRQWRAGNRANAMGARGRAALDGAGLCGWQPGVTKGFLGAALCACVSVLCRVVGSGVCGNQRGFPALAALVAAVAVWPADIFSFEFPVRAITAQRRLPLGFRLCQKCAGQPSDRVVGGGRLRGELLRIESGRKISGAGKSFHALSRPD